MIRTDFEIQDRSPELIKRTQQSGIKAYKKAGKKLVVIVKEGINVRTGTLKGSISYKLNIIDGVPLLDVGAKKKYKNRTAHHAHLYEDGTGQRFHKNGHPLGSMPAKPFLKSKVITMQDILEKILNEEMAKLSDN